MKIILLQDIETLGKKWEVKEVADGYAKNFLIPRVLAKPATQSEVAEAERLLAEVEANAQKALETVEKSASKLDGYELKMRVSVGEEGQLFAQVSPKQIAEGLLRDGFKVSAKQIKIKEPIKELGEFAVTLEFDHGLEVEIRVIVEAE
ncbi:MAG: 50S ribosomal protein L9 [Candidatus Spechtbacterales bacterium]